MNERKTSYSDSFETTDAPNTKKRRTENSEEELNFSEIPVETQLKVEIDFNDFEADSNAESYSTLNKQTVTSLRKELVQWSVVYNISNNALNALLTILQREIPELPTDSSTLKVIPSEGKSVGINNEAHNGTSVGSTQINQNNINSFGKNSECSENMPQMLENNNPCTSGVLQLILRLLTDVNQKVDSLVTEQKEIKQQISSIQTENRKSQNRLLTEVTSQRKFKQNNNQTISLLPKKQFDLITEFEKFEDDLKKSEDLCEKLEEELFQCNISNPSKYIRDIWRKLITDEVATHYSWKGTITKTAVIHMTFTKVFQSAVNRKFLVPEKHFGAITSKWFQTAGDRVKYYKKHTAKLMEN